MKWTILALLLSSPAAQPVRLGHGAILTPVSSSSIEDNLNGPSLIRVPAWVDKPLGRYYLYFAHHTGKFIRLAYANHLDGPWTVYEPGVLQIGEVHACHNHIASPDVHVDSGSKQIRMYFHCPAEGDGAQIEVQKTLLAFSSDGLHFTAKPTLLGPAYFRVFQWKGAYYAITRGGLFLRSNDGVSPFEPGPTLFAEDPKLVLRHAAVDVQGDIAYIYFSRIGDAPERILRSRISLIGDWWKWKATPPVTLLAPGTVEEGAELTIEPSKSGDAPGRVRQLRDPAIFHDDGKTYLLYSIAGESGIAIARIQ